MTKKKVSEEKVEDLNVSYALGYFNALMDSSWKCYDCGNNYGPEVDECPNRALDEAKARLRGAEHRAQQ